MSPLHPLHAILLAFLFPLLVGALFSDLAYSSSYQIQWANFASWLIAGALFVGAFVFLWALVDWFRHLGARNGRRGLYALLLLATLLLGFVNAMVHAKDAYATMPAGLILSVIIAVLALLVSWIGYSGFSRVGDGETK